MKVGDGRRSGNQQNIRRALEQPGESDAHRRSAEALRNGVQRLGLQRSETTEWKVGDVAVPFAASVSMRSSSTRCATSLKILHAHDRRN